MGVNPFVVVDLADNQDYGSETRATSNDFNNVFSTIGSRS